MQKCMVNKPQERVIKIMYQIQAFKLILILDIILIFHDHLRMILRMRNSIFWGYLGMVSLASLWPRGAMPEASSFFSYPNADKAVHFAMYMVLSILGAVTVFRPFRKDYPLIAFLFACLCGIMLELLQSGIIGIKRSASIWDAIANILGAFTGLVIIIVWNVALRAVIQRKYNKKR